MCLSYVCSFVAEGHTIFCLFKPTFYRHGASTSFCVCFNFDTFNKYYALLVQVFPLRVVCSCKTSQHKTLQLMPFSSIIKDFTRLLKNHIATSKKAIVHVGLLTTCTIEVDTIECSLCKWVIYKFMIRTCYSSRCYWGHLPA